MKPIRKTVTKLVFSVIALCFFAAQVQAQGDIDKMISQYKSDGTYLINGYVDPFMKTMASSLNQGWYNTAKPHKVAGVDITVTVNAMYIPNSAKTYNVNNLDTIALTANGKSQFPNGMVPTIFGKDKSPEYHPSGSTDPNDNFSGPGGIDLKKNIGINALPVPMAQLGFGLPKGIELKFRFCPSTKVGDGGKVQMFGIGVLHDVKQYIPGIKMLPFDLSAFVGFTQVKLNYNLADSVTAGSGQQAVYNITGTTIQGVISKKVSVLTVYGGVGYNIAKSKLAVNGTFDTKTGPITDPYSNSFSASSPRITVGARLKLAVFTLHADYTVQKYSCLTVGFGISVR